MRFALLARSYGPASELIEKYRSEIKDAEETDQNQSWMNALCEYRTTLQTALES